MNKFVSCIFAFYFCTSLSLFAETTHVVESGETFYSISRAYGITVTELQKANGMNSSSILKAGQKLIIPSATTKYEKKSENEIYTVQQGDTFYGIAKKNAMTVDQLLAMNGLNKNSVLKTGQKLKVPVTPPDSDPDPLPDLSSVDPRNYGKTVKTDNSLAWPVKTNEITYTTGKVSGVKLSAKANETVTSIRAGSVAYCGVYRGFGQVVFILAKTGHIYAYTGLSSVNVKKGDYVTFGDSLGTVGTDAITQKPQIILMVFLNNKPIDPVKAPRG